MSLLALLLYRHLGKVRKACQVSNRLIQTKKFNQNNQYWITSIEPEALLILPRMFKYSLDLATVTFTSSSSGYFFMLSYPLWTGLALLFLFYQIILQLRLIVLGGL